LFGFRGASVATSTVSVHGKFDRPGRKKISGMLASIQTQLSDPIQRLKAIAEANSVAKQHGLAIGASLLTG
jgi:diacylglycerol O-acyltransferase / wax synthase